MKMLALLGLLLPGAALAQTVGSADKWEGTPQVSLRTPAASAARAPAPGPSPVPAARPAPAPAAPPAGITWQSRPVVTAPARPVAPVAPAPVGTAQSRPAPVAPAARLAPASQPAAGVSWQDRPAALPSRPAQVRRTTPPRPAVRPAPPEDVMRAPEYAAPQEIAQADDYRAIQPGDRVKGAWDHPFYTLDPVRHDLPLPPPGARWIRFVDGALLVEPDGRVLDTRWTLDDPIAPDWAEDHRGDYAGAHSDAHYVGPQGGYAAPGAPAMMVIETTTTTTRGGPPRR